MRSSISTSIVLMSLLFGCKEDISLGQDIQVPPTAEIVAPLDGAVFSEEAAVELIAAVADANGLADVRSVQWSSDVDGDLLVELDGDGIAAASAALTVGEHLLTFRAVDSIGQEGTQTVSVTIEAWAND